MFLLIIHFDGNYYCQLLLCHLLLFFNDYYVLTIIDILMSIFLSNKKKLEFYKSTTRTLTAESPARELTTTLTWVY